MGCESLAGAQLDFGCGVEQEKRRLQTPANHALGWMTQVDYLVPAREGGGLGCSYFLQVLAPLEEPRALCPLR